MIVYYVTFALAILLAWLAQRFGRPSSESERLQGGRTVVPNGFFALLCALLLILVAGLRWQVGTDYGAYRINYTAYANHVWTALIRYQEPGINLIAWISRLLYDDYATMLFLAAALTVGLFVGTSKRYSLDFPFAIAIYLMVGAWHGCFNGVRQYLAAAVLFAGHRYMLERKFWRYALVVFVASLFHTTALVMILPYFFMTRKPDWKQFLVMLLGVILIRYSYDAIFDLVGFYKGHDIVIDEYVTNEVNPLRIAVAFAPVVVYLFFTDKRSMGKADYFYINGILLNAFALFATMNSTYLARACIYTESYLIIGYGYLVRLIKDKRVRWLALFFICILYWFYWWYSISESGSLNHFQWIWNRSN